MKTKLYLIVIVLLCVCGGLNLTNAQGLFDLAVDEDDGIDLPLSWSAGPNFLNDNAFNDFVDSRVGWANSTIGGTAGVGFSDDDGNSSSSFCFGAEYLHRIIGEQRNPNGAGYLGAFANYHSSNSDFFDESLFQFGAKFSYFDRITKLNTVQLNYGVKAFYETGSRDFPGVSEDVTGWGGSAFLGANFRVNNDISIGVEAPVFTYRDRTFEANGSEFNTDGFSALINKDNPVTATVRFNIGNAFKFGGKDTDGDGIEDIEDECPEQWGHAFLNGCPDTDGDGIADQKDNCPTVAGPAANNGCPDSDGND